MGRKRRASGKKRVSAGGDSGPSNRNEDTNHHPPDEQERVRNMKSYHLALEILQKYRAEKKSSCSELQKNGANPNLTIKNLNWSCEQTANSKMRYITLEELASKEASEILFTLSFPGNGFKELLNANELGSNMMEVILIVLAKTTKAREIKNLKSFFNVVVTETSFIKLHLYHYVVSLQKSYISKINKSGALPNAILFLAKLQEIQPDTSSAVMPFILPLLKDMIHKLSKIGLIIPPDIKKKIEILQKKEEIAAMQFHYETSSGSEKYYTNIQPPEYFRTIPILPTKEDITNMRPLFPTNGVKGSFVDVEGYLDIQFRLLREQYIRPLRETIQKYKISLGDSNESLRNVRIYKNVHIVHSYNTEGGLVHLISFDVKPFTRIDWEVSKLLQPGSLLCLSSDNFDTMKIATVAKRNISQLRDGKLEIHFEQLEDQIFYISPSSTLVMAECEAYFEAIRYTLESLQQIKYDEFPFKDYIFNVQKEINIPKYLNEDTVYNFSSTFPGISQRYSAVPILNKTLWPPKEELRLNHSQYAALKAALTKEFVIIEGPSGSGKKSLGLKVTQMLLENAKSSPILLLCYTNHAMDQFLEGILTLTKDVVRVGGRCINDKLKEYKLGKIRQKERCSHKVPTHIYLQKRAILEQMENIEDRFESYYCDIENSTQQVLTVEVLQPFIEKRQINCLQEGSVNNTSQSKMYTIADWLNIPHSSQMDYLESSDEEEEQINTRYDIKTIFDKAEDKIDFEVSFRELEEDDYKQINKENRKKVMPEQSNSATPIQFTINTLLSSYKMKQYLRQHLKCQNTMTDSEEKQIENIWTLANDKRWSLYRLWIARYLTNLSECIFYFLKHYQELSEKLKELRIAEDICLLRKAKVIGMTTTSASKYHEFLKDLQPQIVIVAEAAEVLEAHVLNLLAENTQHLILIGDNQQLKPSPTAYKLSKKRSFDICLFKRMIKNKMPCYQLSAERQMRPSILKLLAPHIYSTLANDSSAKIHERILGVKANMFFINHTEYEGIIGGPKTHSNLHEAAFLVKLCKYLTCQGYDPSQLTVLTANSDQFLALRKSIKQEKGVEDIRLALIDRDKGGENDIVLISFVTTNVEAEGMCVALSRAKKGLYCIGNFELLAETSHLWRNVTSELKGQNAIGQSLELCCQIHPEITITVSKAEDFTKYLPRGFCSKPCNLKMKCGHTCPRSCHVDDREHTEVKCFKPCTKICNLNHVCPKLCYEECGECKIHVEWICSKCNYVYNDVPCHLKRNQLSGCEKACKKILRCGHTCSKLCYQRCGPCSKIIMKRFACTHAVQIPCSEANNYIVCQKLCNEILKCGHMCTNICGIKPCPPCQIGTVTPCERKHEAGKTESECSVM